MVDKLSVADRTRLMSGIRTRDTAPEIKVRKLLHAAGLRFRLHRRDLPGKPDIVLTRHRTIVFVHGCFWHGHDCRKGRRPSSNRSFWDAKLDRNVERDRTIEQELRERGWNVETVWECQLASDTARIVDRLTNQSNELTR